MLSPRPGSDAQTRHEIEKQNGLSEEMNQDTLSRICPVNTGLISLCFTGTYPAEPSLFVSLNIFFFSFLSPHTKQLLPTFPPEWFSPSSHPAPIIGGRSLVANAVGQPSGRGPRVPLSLCGWNSSLWLP